MTEEKEKPESQDHEFGPGALLKRTREEKDLSLKEVSTSLKLTIPMLQKIEADDYEGDLPVTFYRGYLKNYSELLGLQDVDIVANFQDFCKKNNLFNTPPPRLQGTELNKPMTSSNWIFKVITGLIILILLAAIYYVVVEKELWKKVIPSDSGEQVIQSDDNSLSLGSESSSDSLTLESNNTLETAGDNQPAVQTQPEMSSEPTDEQAQPSKSNDGELALESTAERRDEVETSAINTMSGASSTLGLTFSDDCWVKIQDSTGKVLAIGLKTSGSSLNLSGSAPFDLTLGKASAVQLTYDGEFVDLTNYPDTRAARLTLGDE